MAAYNDVLSTLTIRIRLTKRVNGPVVAVQRSGCLDYLLAIDGDRILTGTTSSWDRIVSSA